MLLSSRLSRALRPLPSAALFRYSTSSSPPTASKAATFFDSHVQHELRFLTGVDFSRVFRVARRGQNIPAPTYQYVTDSELAEMRSEAARAAKKKLQMPPVMDERTPIDRVLDEDPALKGYEAPSVKLVFTDITYGVRDRERIMVVREPDGRLREAEWAERDRLNQIYFPREGRKLDMPPMFEAAELQEILSPDRYEYILDRNCVQFEPDHPVFLATCQSVFGHVDKEGHYDVLFSTRHFGPMVFHLVWEKRCDDLITHFFKKADLERAVSVVRVYSKVHTESAVAAAKPSTTDLDLLRLFIEKDSLKSAKLHVALEAALEAVEKARSTSDGLKKAHGSDT